MSSQSQIHLHSIQLHTYTTSKHFYFKHNLHLKSSHLKIISICCFSWVSSYTLGYSSWCINVTRSISKILWSKMFTDYFRYMLAYISLLIIFLLIDIYLFFLDKVTWSSLSPKLINILNPVSVWSLVFPKKMG